MKYDHKEIEQKWQKFWNENKIYTTTDAAPGKDNFYLLVEFPYPSGNLHVGHWYAFAVPDILARYHRMNGKNVMYPIGFDAFGLPAENAAIKNKLNPRDWTEKNIAYMKKQIGSMGASFDWSREVSTIDPAYYKWTQWLFLQLYKKGLVYQKETAVNWCPKDMTVLANEQVIDGKCDRCGSEVEQRQMLQWNIKITDYADRLIDDLKDLDWPEQIKESQRNWIGRSEGAEIDFTVGDDLITVFTTRPDTLFGATYLVLAPEHGMVKQLQSQIQNWSEVEAYINRTNKMSDMDRQTTKEKTGERLKGVEAFNPATGEKIPVFIADYVLPQYGTGAIMAVPAHDERDYEFAIKFQLSIKQVVRPVFNPLEKKEGTKWRDTVSAFVRNDNGEVLMLRWPEYKWLTGVVGGIEQGETPEQTAVREVYEETGYRAKALFSSPIKIESHYYAEHKKEWRSRIDTAVLLELESDERDAVSAEEAALHEAHWIKIEEALQMEMFPNNKLALELALGRVKAYTGTRYGESPALVNSGAYEGMSVADGIPALTEAFGRKKTTYKLRDWIVSRQRYWGVPIPMIHCDTCGQQPVPDAELPVVLPDVEDYLPEGSGKSPLAKVASFVNVKCPKCGADAKRETDTLDTFVDSSWYFLRYTDPKNESEFASRAKQDSWMPVDMYSGGAEHTTMHLLYSRFWHKALFDLGLVGDSEPYEKRVNHGLVLGTDGQKMSKSKGNVLDPDEVVERLGADTVRMYLAFMGPYTGGASYPWNPDSIVGIRRFIERVAKAGEYVQDGEVAALNTILHKTLKKVGEDIAAMKFNTAISQLMILLNAIEKDKKIGKEQWKLLVRMIAPFAPHLAEELWNSSSIRSQTSESSVHLEEWPAYDTAHLAESEVTIAIQIDGKTRADVRVPADADKAAVEAAAREAVASRLEGKTVARAIVVPGRLVNFVLEN